MPSGSVAPHEKRAAGYRSCRTCNRNTSRSAFVRNCFGSPVCPQCRHSEAASSNANSPTGDVTCWSSVLPHLAQAPGIRHAGRSGCKMLSACRSKCRRGATVAFFSSHALGEGSRGRPRDVDAGDDVRHALGINVDGIAVNDQRAGGDRIRPSEAGDPAWAEACPFGRFERDRLGKGRVRRCRKADGAKELVGRVDLKTAPS